MGVSVSPNYVINPIYIETPLSISTRGDSSDCEYYPCVYDIRSNSEERYQQNGMEMQSPPYLSFLTVSLTWKIKGRRDNHYVQSNNQQQPTENGENIQMIVDLILRKRITDHQWIAKVSTTFQGNQWKYSIPRPACLTFIVPGRNNIPCRVIAAPDEENQNFQLWMNHLGKNPLPLPNIAEHTSPILSIEMTILPPYFERFMMNVARQNALLTTANRSNNPHHPNEQGSNANNHPTTQTTRGNLPITRSQSSSQSNGQSSSRNSGSGVSGNTKNMLLVAMSAEKVSFHVFSILTE